MHPLQVSNGTAFKDVTISILYVYLLLEILLEIWLLLLIMVINNSTTSSPLYYSRHIFLICISLSVFSSLSLNNRRHK